MAERRCLKCNMVWPATPYKGAVRYSCKVNGPRHKWPPLGTWENALEVEVKRG